MVESSPLQLASTTIGSELVSVVLWRDCGPAAGCCAGTAWLSTAAAIHCCRLAPCRGHGEPE
jgi:hypothetical protein